MGTTSTGFHLVQTVPYRRTVDGLRYTLGIARVRSDPPMVTVGVTPRQGREERYDLQVGELLAVGSERWRLQAIGLDEVGSADFVPEPPA